MKRADKICILVIMISCVLFYVPLWFAYDTQGAGDVVVRVREAEVLRVPLQEDGTYAVDGKLGEVEIEVKDGQVRGREGELAVSLLFHPRICQRSGNADHLSSNEVVVQIEGGGEGAVDTRSARL